MGSGAVTQGQNYNVPQCGFNRSGYSFINWNTAANGSGDWYAPGEAINNVQANTTLYAQWLEQVLPAFTISCHPNGGSGDITSTTVTQGQSYTVPPCSFIRDGYAFVNWNLAANGNDTWYAPGTVIPNVQAGFTLYAQWQEQVLPTFTISCHPNGGSGDITSTTVTQGQNYIVPVCSFSHEGFVFSKWATEADGGGTLYAPGEQIPNIQGNVTLFAQWE
jgi:hypothetical protein